MFERPPPGISGNFMASESVELAMRCDRGKQVEEVLNDMESRSRVHADRNESAKCISRKTRVLDCQSL